MKSYAKHLSEVKMFEHGTGEVDNSGGFNPYSNFGSQSPQPMM